MVRPTLIDLNPVECKYYPFMISLDKFHVIVNAKLKWNNKTCKCECNSYRNYKINYSWNPPTCICENGKYLESIADTSVTVCDEIIHVMGIASTKITNTIATRTVSMTSDGKSKK